jgi:hypothetical protein
MLLCNISKSREMIIRQSIKSQNIVSIFLNHKCNVSNNYIYICTLEKTHHANC